MDPCAGHWSKRTCAGTVSTLARQVGYKLKFYGDDARIASRELSIMCFPEKNLMTAMIPVHRLHIHVRRLISAGYKVGVVRQTETRALKAASANASAPFARELTALYTASTWVDDLSSDASSSAAAVHEEHGFSNPAAQRSLLAIVEKSEGGNGRDDRVAVGLIAVQAATGSVTYDQFQDGLTRQELETRLAHLQPAEVLRPSRLTHQTEKMIRFLASTQVGGPAQTRLRVEEVEMPRTYDEAWRTVSSFYEAALSTERRSTQGASPSAASDSDALNRGKLLSFAKTLPHLALVALAGTIAHLEKFGLTNVFRIVTNFSSFASRSQMLLTGTTLHNLEIFRNSDDGRDRGSLIWLLDRCKTAFGKRLLRKWVARPLNDLAALSDRTDAIEALVAGGTAEHPIASRLPGLLQGLPDLEKGLARLSYGRSQPTELATVLLSLLRVSHEFEQVQDANELGIKSKLLAEAVAALPRARSAVKEATNAISLTAARADNKQDLFVDPERFPILQECRDLITSCEIELRSHLLEIRKETRMPRLEFVTVSNISNLLEIRVADAKKMPATWLRISATQKFVRFHTPQTIKLLKEKDRATETLEKEANAAYDTFVRELCARHYTELRNTISGLATLDACLSLANVAALPGYRRPVFHDGDGDLELKGFRHPMSEALAVLGDYVPNDVSLGGNSAMGILLTGSNMGGKSSTVRAIALIIIMAQIGSYVPADFAHLPLHDAVLTRMGASDELAKGRSTFMVEMAETKEIVSSATNRSLCILDELGRGTSTFDGTAVAYAVLVNLMSREASRRPKLLFVTHFHALGSLAEPHSGLSIRAMHMAVLENEGDRRGRGIDDPSPSDVTFLYKLRDGLASKS
ncbi:hypothetical protein IE81DRAFT_165551 [Ceraceosorus guamensis]|uniref:MutS protein homolog 3 n=1 Tax=Ceraceosorus guamensis TaxID=1522189 RepID=A0A316W713_9BASI|nr:hypothetical protein IE81DRAFT_165551 [Ceraceosorus guamensis]PWN45677.1 hypothetical protein IE81DRAFT_165551 [Ceraceosorus guamensis]